MSANQAVTLELGWLAGRRSRRPALGWPRLTAIEWREVQPERQPGVVSSLPIRLEADLGAHPATSTPAIDRFAFLSILTSNPSKARS